jgi:hypothetical protein
LALPNLPSLYQKIGRGSEGGNEFARTITQLLIADGRERNFEVITSSDCSGDYKGVDAIIKIRWKNSDQYRYTGVQFKFFPSPLSTNHKSLIRGSLIKAVDKFPEMVSWILVTPEDFYKKDIEWFDKLREEFEYMPTLDELAIDLTQRKNRQTFEIDHWGHSHIMTLMRENPSIGRQYFKQEMFIHEERSLLLSKVSIDSSSINWHKLDDEFHIRYTPIQKQPGVNKSSDLVFDFQFINNTNSIHTLHQIDVHIEEVWTRLKGIPGIELLKSIGTIEYEIDFSKPVNSLNLERLLGGPIIFNANEPKRFSLQLAHFAKNCPGNMAKIHFIFIFNSVQLKSSTFTLDM